MPSEQVVPEALTAEADLAPVMCAHCEAEFGGGGDAWPSVCSRCGRDIDLEAQFAYCRGRDAFIAGQDLLIALTPKMRRRNITTTFEMEGLQYYSQAYSALLRAFQGQLAESQRRLAIEMTAAMVLVFQTHGSISPFESSYWTTLMVDLTTQLDIVEVRERLGKLPAGVSGALSRWRWRLRLRQLERALVELDTKIRTLEQNIGFVEPPRARKRFV